MVGGTTSERGAGVKANGNGVRSERGGRLLTVAEAATWLRDLGTDVLWSEDSIREHLVSIDVWKRDGAFNSGKVPSLPLGHQVRIPAWWIEGMRERVNGPGV